MTQTNTTQNKEELIKTIKLIFDRDLTAKQEFLLSKEIDKSLSQAHQSGIEEERKRIKTNIGFLRQWINEKPEKMLVTNEDIEEWLFNFESLKENNDK